MVLAFYLWEGYTFGVQNKFVLGKGGEWIERKHSQLHASYMYQSGFNQVNRGSRLYGLRGLLGGTGSQGSVVWLVERTPQGRGQPGTPGHERKQLSTVEFLLLLGASPLL